MRTSQDALLEQILRLLVELIHRVADQAESVKSLHENQERCLAAVQPLAEQQRAGAVKTFCTVAEFAEQVDRRPYTIREWIKAGKVRVVKPPGAGKKAPWMIPTSEIARLRCAAANDNSEACAGLEQIGGLAGSIRDENDLEKPTRQVP